MTKKTVSERLGEREVEKFARVAEAKRATQVVRTALAEKEKEVAEISARLASYEHPSLHSVEQLLEQKPTWTRKQIAKALKIDADATDAVLEEMAARGFNVQDGVVSKQGGGKRPEVEHFYGPEVRFGALSDVHLGNAHAMEHELGEAYEVFRREGIRDVYAGGNLIDGEKTYRGQEYEIDVMGADNVVANLKRKWPRIPEITTHHIASSTCHEGYYLKSAGLLIGKMIERERPDMKYLGLDEADVALQDCPARPMLRLIHPGGGSSYADSYRPQKIVESYSGGEKPTVLLVSHYHKSLQDDIRDVAVFETGCLETQTPFMRKHSIRAVLGFWIIDLRFTDDGSLRRVRGEFFKYYMGRDGQVLRNWTVT